MSELVTYEAIGNVAVLTIENPPVNALSPGVPEGIADGIERAQQDAGIDAIIIRGGGRTFIAGADIRQLEKLARGETARSPALKEMLVRMEDSPKPIVSAIHGTALGGGLELAMACHYRVALAGSKVGQPEVKLGIIPGAAGTQRLPRLVGVTKAAEMCALGDPMAVDVAHQLGLVDAVVTGDLLEKTLAWVQDQDRVHQPPPKTRDRNDRLTISKEDEKFLADLRAKASARRSTAKGALAAIDAVEQACALSFEAGCDYEEKLFEDCLRSPSAQGLMHVFFGEREVAKIPDVPATTAILPVQTVAVLGAGTMGAGIATSYLAAGFQVLLYDADAAARDRGASTIRQNLERLAKRRGWSAAEVDKRFASLGLLDSMNGVDRAELVVEAVFENMKLKKEVFTELDRLASANAILATNTSTLSIDEIASATSRPESVIGHHFFSPAHVMRLLEIVRGVKTRKEILATSMHLAKRLGKIGVLVGNCRGFVGNRMYGPYQREAQFLVEEGATPAQVDRVMVEFGMAMGPLAVGDLSGLDVGWRVRKEFAHLDPPGWRMPRISDRLCELGRYGQKTGAGWYQYPAGGRSAELDPAVDAIIAEVAREVGVEQRSVADQEIEERLLLALVVEGCRILEDRIAIRAVDIDIIYVNGYGFPADRGGPMFHAESVGWGKILDRARHYERTHGPWWTPPKFLEELAGAGRSLYRQ